MLIIKSTLKEKQISKILPIITQFHRDLTLILLSRYQIKKYSEIWRIHV